MVCMDLVSYIACERERQKRRQITRCIICINAGAPTSLTLPNVYNVIDFG